MIFRDTWQQMLDRTKTNSRRLEKEGDRWWRRNKAGAEVQFWAERDDPSCGPIVEVMRGGRILYRVGRTYAIQPGRTAKGIGRTTPLKSIERQRVQDITPEDVIAEGIDLMPHLPFAASVVGLEEAGLSSLIQITAHRLFAELWDSLHPAPATNWESNCRVYRLGFEDGERVTGKETIC